MRNLNEQLCTVLAAGPPIVSSPSLKRRVVDLDKDRLQQAPHYARASEEEWRDPAYGTRVSDYYLGSLGAY